MDDPDSSVSLSNLICQEDITRLDDDDEEETFKYQIDSFLVETQAEYIEMLVSRECSFDSKNSEVVDSLNCARSDSVQWILSMNACFGFGPQTAYLAVTYFDRFLVRRTVHEGKDWALRLLSVACLSLAAKMEEVRPPGLSEFQIEECHFENATIQRMELLVLNTLEWRMNSVIPFAYLDYFASKLVTDIGVEEILYRAMESIFAIVKVINLMDYRPSTIAAAAILAASGQLLTQKLIESTISIISLPESLEAEHVFACYSVMIQETERKKLKASKAFVSSDQSANCTSVNSPVDVIDTVSYRTSSFKRRRLELD